MTRNETPKTERQRREKRTKINEFTKEKRKVKNKIKKNKHRLAYITKKKIIKIIRKRPTWKVENICEESLKPVSTNKYEESIKLRDPTVPINKCISMKPTNSNFSITSPVHTTIRSTNVISKTNVSDISEMDTNIIKNDKTETINVYNETHDNKVMHEVCDSESKKHDLFVLNENIAKRKMSCKNEKFVCKKTKKSAVSTESILLTKSNVSLRKVLPEELMLFELSVKSLEPTTCTTNNLIDNISIQNPNTIIENMEKYTEIENLYKKYFTPYVQDTIVIIANILNIISLSKEYKKNMKNVFERETKAETLKKINGLKKLQIYVSHKEILVSKLRYNFMSIMSSFISDIEYKSILRMFCFGILNVLYDLNQSKNNKKNIIMKCIFELGNGFKNCSIEYSKVFLAVKSKLFLSNCLDLLNLIENNCKRDVSIVDRLGFFFVSSVNSLNYFQPVIDAVINNSDEDIGILIEEVALNFRKNSRCKV